MDHASLQMITEFRSAHPRFQEKNLLKTRSELSRQILSLEMEEDRRSWLLHRLSYAHSPEEVTELIAQVRNE
jgi:hypothetical protein